MITPLEVGGTLYGINKKIRVENGRLIRYAPPYLIRSLYSKCPHEIQVVLFFTEEEIRIRPSCLVPAYESVRSKNMP